MRHAVFSPGLSSRILAGAEAILPGKVRRPMDLSDRLAAIRTQLDDGEEKRGLRDARALSVECPTDPRVALVHAEAAWANDSIEECRHVSEHALTLLGPVVADRRAAWELAEVHYWLGRVEWRLWRFAEAERELRTALEMAPDDPSLWALLAEVLERTGRDGEAKDADRRAEELDPERFPHPVRFARKEAEAALREALEALPEEFQDAVAEVPIILERFPALQMVRAEDPGALPFPPDILGLYTGVSRADRSYFHGFEPPGTILLFQGNLERLCADRDTLIEEIAITLEHELAHYLGFEESAMEDLGLE